MFAIDGFAKPASLHKQLLTLYQDHRSTFFCEQPFSEKGDIEYSACKQCPKSVTRIQWMPIVPLSKLAKNMHCYHEKFCINKQGHRFKGLSCCQERDPIFQKMMKDLHNYVPEHPLLKKERGHYDFGMATFKPSTKCHFEVDKKLKIAKISPYQLGFIARTYLYFYEKYHLFLSAEEIALYAKWDKQYPATDWEKNRNAKILASIN